MIHLAITLALAGAGAPAPAPSFACRAGPAGPTAADELDELRRDLRDRYPDRRRRAVRRLVELGTDDALELVLEALGDADGQPADEAQLGLPRFSTEDALERVSGREGLGAKDPWVRFRAAEALGRWERSVPLDLLTEALDRREPRASRAVLWSIERLARGGRLTVPERGRPWRPLDALLGRRADDGVRAAAVAARAAASPQRCRAALAELGDDAGPETRVAALAAGLELGEEGGRTALVAALGDPDPFVRAAAARLASRHADRGVVLALAERLETEPRPCVRDLVAAALGAATGLGHGRHARSWRRAAEDLPEGWRAVVPAEGAERGEIPPGTSVAAVGRLDLRSDRVGVLVDFSGSLWNEREDGTRRKDALDPQVEALLAAMGEGTRFFLLPYTHDNHPFDEEPLDATRRNVRRAQEFFRRATMRGKGDLWGALELALQHPELDRLVVVTDGAPTGGRHWNVGLIGELLAERTRFRPVVVDMVLLDAPKGLQRRWAPVVRALGGRLVAVDR